MFIFKKFLQGVMLLIISFYSYAESSLQQLLDNKNYNDFFVQAEIKAQKQDKEALFLLGKAYQFGLGTQLDLIKAMAFYNQASELGEPRAYNNIGTIYEQANNMPRAIKFYKKAYDHGLEKIAITNLARSCLQLMYTRYRGISYFDYENDDKSCTEYNEILYKKNSSKVNLNALSKAKLLAFIFNPTSDNEIRSEVLEWLDKAIAEGSVEAITNKGIYYQTIGDNEQATVLFKEAADKGQVLAILKMGEVLGSNNIEGILWYSKAASKGSREGADKINYFANQYSYWYKEHPKVTRNQFEKILNNLQKHIEYIRLNNLDPITELPFQEYDSKTAADVYSKLKQITDSIDLLNEYQLTLENNKPTYSTNNIVTMTRQLQSAGYADANVNWEITTFSGDKILAKGISSEEGLVDLRLTKPDNEKIINYLNQGGILRFGYKQFAWFLTNELEGNIINLKLHLELAMLVNMSKGHTPEAYIIIYE